MTRHQKGFTLIELLAVMAIVGILAAVVIPAVSGSTDASERARAQGGASAVEGAVVDFFLEQTGAETLRSHSADVTASFVDLEGNSRDASSPTAQLISSKWPETLITAEITRSDSAYLAEFPTASSPTDGVVTQVTLLDPNGRAISEKRLLTSFTAIDFAVLTGETPPELDPRSNEFLRKTPEESRKRTADDRFHILLWLFEKPVLTDDGDVDDARTVVVFKLIRLEKSDEGESETSGVKLTYEAVIATLDTDDEPTPTPTAVPHLKYVDDDACPSTGTGTPSDPFCSIQIAIDNASPGDTILVGPGTYTGPVTVNKSVTLTGQSSPVVIGGPITFDVSGTGAIIDGFDARSAGFAVIKIGSGAHGVTVRNNTISGGAQYGIHIDGASDNTIEDNELIGSSDCIRLGELASGNVVRRNTIAACDQSGVHVAGSNNTIEGNAISGGSNAGIFVEGAGNTILDNTVLGAPVTGIVIAHLSGNLVEDNLVKDSGGDGIAVILGAADTTVHSNTVSGADKTGITVDEATNTTVRENTVSGSQLGGIAVTGGSTNTQIDRNAVSRSATFGIVVADGSIGTFVRFNTLADSLGNAVSVNGRGGAARNTLVQGNTISGRSAVGINVSGAVNTAVRGNRITGSSVFGISLALSAGNVVRENTVINSGNVGISLNNAHQSIVSVNAVSGSVGDGIVLGARSSNNTVEANNVSGSGSSGISVKENASRNTFRSNDLGPSGDFDAKDTTTGRGTAGTANTWTFNECSTSSPDGLCS